MISVSDPGRNRAALALAYVAAAALLAGCADKRGGPIPYETGTFRAPDAPTIATVESNYKIAPLDTITVKVFKMADLSGDYEIDLTGQLSMPLIGNVKAVDLTTVQLDQVLTAEARREISREPGCDGRGQVVDPAQRHGRRRGQARQARSR